MYDTKSQRIFLYNLQKEFYDLVADNYYAPLNLQSETILKVFSKDHNKTKTFVQQNKSILYQKDVIDYLIQKVGINPSELLFSKYYAYEYDYEYDYIIQRIKDCNCIIPGKIMKKFINRWEFCLYSRRAYSRVSLTKDNKVHKNITRLLTTLFQYGGTPFYKYVKTNVVDIQLFPDTVYKCVDRVMGCRRKWVLKCITSFQRKYRERYYRPGGKGFKVASSEFHSQLELKCI